MTNKVFINPGHAPGIDPGACNEALNLQEADIVLKIGQLVSKYLQRAGLETQVMQSDDLTAVCLASNVFESDVFVSIHCNSFSDSLASGTETWYLTKSSKGRYLAALIHSQILSRFSITNRSIKESIPGESGLYVLENTDAPAVLVETAFISNTKKDALLFQSENSIDQFARAIACGITDYYLVVNKINE